MSQLTQWCNMCRAGATKEVTRTHYWCTNCGCVFDEHGVCRGIPTKIGPDPKERRDAWDRYAASAMVHFGDKRDSRELRAKLAGEHADGMLAERDARFCGVAQEVVPRAVNSKDAGSSPAPAAKE